MDWILCSLSTWLWFIRATPLRTVDQNEYLTWGVDSFKLATAGVTEKTQIHSHFCYSDFNSIFDHIIRLDADVISIEASKSDERLLTVFEKYGYPNAIGPGVYDIHSYVLQSICLRESQVLIRLLK